MDHEGKFNVSGIYSPVGSFSFEVEHLRAKDRVSRTLCCTELIRECAACQGVCVPVYSGEFDAKSGKLLGNSESPLYPGYVMTFELRPVAELVG